MDAYCERRVPDHVRDQVRMHHEFHGDSITLFEDRPFWKNPKEWTHMAIAQLRFDKDTGKWTLYCADSNFRWHRYNIAESSGDLELLLKVIDEDPTGIFFG